MFYRNLFIASSFYGSYNETIHGVLKVSSKKGFFQKVGETKIIPISFKLLFIFICLLLLSNFTTNFITLQLSKKQTIELSNTIMVSQLKDIYTTAGNQFQIFTFTGDEASSLAAIETVARSSFSQDHSLACAFNENGDFLFCSQAQPVESAPSADESKPEGESVSDSESSPAYDSSEVLSFKDSPVLSFLNSQLAAGITDGSISFTGPLGDYFGVYKYQEDWKCFFVRAELRKDTNRSAMMVMAIISIIIAILVAGFLIAGLFMFSKVLANVKRITDSLYKMQEEQHLSLIDLSDSPNDDVTYLAASFNSLSATINNLMGIFQKFVSKDVVAKAYKEHTIRLEGNRRNLTMLFSDIKSFTYRTETLGTDIIDLLNVHYDRVIHSVHENQGVIGSIIGDAILAVYGTGDSSEKKSLSAVDAAWSITRVTADLREKMVERRKEIELKRKLTEAEERIYQAVLIDVGVGIDGGTVFYGNIGSDEHMTNTVIGDNVNAASRLEGLTRIYKVPVIVSGYVKNEVEKASDKYAFYEIDTVQVKGKTEGVKIYFPLEKASAADGIEEKLDLFEQGLSEYYSGDWSGARKTFKKVDLDLTGVFLERMGAKSAPADWSGIWTMTTK